MSDQILKLGQELLSMGQKIIDNQGNGKKKHEEKEDEGDSSSENKGKVLDMPNKALIVASLKRKIGE